MSKTCPFSSGVLPVNGLTAGVPVLLERALAALRVTPVPAVLLAEAVPLIGVAVGFEVMTRILWKLGVVLQSRRPPTDVSYRTFYNCVETTDSTTSKYTIEVIR